MKYLYDSLSPVISEILTTERASYGLINKILPRIGYTLDYKKHVFSRDVSNLGKADLRELRAAKTSEFNTETVLQVFHDSLLNHPFF